jgi:hypothetical protein
MLASITPLGEQGRERNWATTTAFYFAGSITGGATVGITLGWLGSLIPASVRPSAAVVAGIVGVLALIVAAAEMGWIHLPLPTVHRQVNENWLDTYRGWVVGFGFGYQLGLGWATIVTTGAIYLTFLIEFLTFSWQGGLIIGIAFGLARALPLLATRRVTTPSGLQSLHRRVEALAQPMNGMLAGSCAIAGAAALLAGVAA